MGRKPTELAVLPAEPIYNEAAFTRLAQDTDELVLLQAQHESAVRCVALQMGYQLPADCCDPDLIQRDIMSNMRRSVEAVLEVGKGLRVLKEVCPHGNFMSRLEVMNIEPRVAQRFMQSAVKFPKASTSTLLKAAGNQSKLFEMLILDDEQLEELELTGQTGELKLDDVSTMSVKELRQAVRQSRKDGEFEAGKRQKAEAERDAAEKLLRGNRPITVPLDVRLNPLQKEITDRQELLEKCLVAHHQAVAALDSWHATEVTSQADYDPQRYVPLPDEARVVLMHMVDATERTANLVGALQAKMDELWGTDIAAARQYLMRETGTAGAAGE